MSAQMSHTVILEMDSTKLNEQIAALEKAGIGGGAQIGTGGLDGSAVGKQMDMMNRVFTKLTESAMNLEAKFTDLLQVDMGQMNKMQKAKTSTVDSEVQAVLAQLENSDLYGEGGVANKEASAAKRAESPMGKAEEHLRKLEKTFSTSGKVFALLTATSVAVGLAVSQLVKHSAIAQASFEIFGVAMDLFFRPFGDMLGYILMPFALGMLQFAIPFFADMIVRVQKWSEYYEGFLKALVDLDFAKAAEMFTKGIDVLFDPDGRLLKNIGEWFVMAGQVIYGLLVHIGEEIWNVIVNAVSDVFGTISAFFQDNLIAPIQEAWGRVVEWVGGMVGSLVGAWDNFISSISRIGETLQNAWNGLVSWMAGIGASLVKAWDDFVNALSLGGLMTALNNAWVSLTQDITWEGLQSALNKLWKDLTTNAWNFILSLIGLGGASPQEEEQSTQEPTERTSNRGGGRTRRYAEGGIIDELVEGYGASSGDRYLFGESGREVVSPIGGGGRTVNVGSPNITINVSGGDADQMKRELESSIVEIVKNAIKRADNEVTLT